MVKELLTMSLEQIIEENKKIIKEERLKGIKENR